MIQPKLDTLQSVELAEGVQVLLRPAGPAPRAMALLLDLVFIAVLILLTSLFGMLVAGWIGIETGMGMLTLLLFTIYWGYFIIGEVFRNGQTYGKKLMGLRVVRTSGARVGWGAAVMRNLIRFADMMPLWPQTAGWFGFYLFGLTSCLCTRRFQRLGDLVADTVVIYAKADDRSDGSRLREPIVPQAPPVVLTREEQQAFMHFIERAATWSDARKAEMVSSLAEVLGTTDHERVTRALAIGAWVRDS